MTGEEKRKQLKEQMKQAYKDDLKKRKEIQEKMKNLRHTRKLNQAITEITSGLTSDDSDDWIEKLNQESALSEAKLELSLDSASEVNKEIDKLEKDTQVEKFSAEQLVNEMKKEMGLLEEEPEAPEEEDKEEPPQKKLGDF